MLGSRAENIKKSVSDKGIKFLCHFTSINNLNSILDNGLLSREVLNEIEQPFDFNDEYRLDRYESAICLSVMFPNYKMFYKLRQLKENKNKQWCVLALYPSILWKKDCAFCSDNAASSSSRNKNLDDRKTSDAFEQMFCESFKSRYISDSLITYGIRAKCSLASYYPTNPQAEVLCFDEISTDFIGGVAFNNRDIMNVYKEKYPNTKMKIMSSLFRGRDDYLEWKNG